MTTDIPAWKQLIGNNLKSDAIEDWFKTQIAQYL